MKVVGVIVTTIIESAEIDLPDDLPESEIGELFMKTAMTLSPKVAISKSVRFCPIGRFFPSPSASSEQDRSVDVPANPQKPLDLADLG
jgi:hypothetical protein